MPDLRRPTEWGEHPSVRNTRLLDLYKPAGVGPRYTACLRCCEPKGGRHRDDWLDCRGECQGCPPDQQHWGEICPNLLRLFDNSWWNLRVGRNKPGFYTFESTQDLPRAMKQEDHAFTAVERGYSARGSNRPAPQQSYSFTMASSYESSSKKRVRADETAGDMRKKQRQTAPRPPSSPLPQVYKGQEPTYNHDPSYRGRPASGLSEVPSPQAEDSTYRMLVQQTILFADFFQRHPEITGGEQVVSDGMVQYLDILRAQLPQYLLPTLQQQNHAVEQQAPAASSTPAPPTIKIEHEISYTDMFATRSAQKPSAHIDPKSLNESIDELIQEESRPLRAATERSVPLRSRVTE